MRLADSDGVQRAAPRRRGEYNLNSLRRPSNSSSHGQRTPPSYRAFRPTTFSLSLVNKLMLPQEIDDSHLHLWRNPEEMPVGGSPRELHVFVFGFRAVFGPEG
jgi:hypothetical protein